MENYVWNDNIIGTGVGNGKVGEIVFNDKAANYALPHIEKLESFCSFHQL